jgi:integrase
MELTRDKIMDFVQYRLRKTSPYAAKRDIQYLSSAFNWGIQKNYLESNPCVGIKRPRLPEKQPLYFTNEEFDRLLNVIDNADLKDVILFAVNTGLRQMELLRLKWEQINFPEKLLYVNNQVYMSKTLRIRTIPLNYKALEILNKRFVNKQEEYIFTYQGKIIKQELMSHKFKNYVITSGVNSKLNFHSLRHTFASWLVQRGATIYDVSKLLGHSTIKSTEIYAHLRVDELRNAVEKLN